MQIKFLIDNFEHLLNIDKPKYLIYAETGGRGSGKTQQTATAILEVAANAKKRIFATRKEETKLELSSYRELKDKIDAGFWAKGCQYNKSCMWNTLTGSTIDFVGVNDINEANREALKGLANAHIIWVDEAQTLTMATLNVLMPLLGRVEDSCIIFTFNKIREKLPIWEKLGLDNPPSHVHFNETNYKQNFLLPKAFHIEAEDVKRRFPAIYERDYMNNPCADDDGKVTKNWSNENIKAVPYIPLMPMHITCDFNASPNCWELAHKDDKRVYFFDEFCKDKSTGKLIQEVLDAYPHEGLIIINGDASGNQHKSCNDKTDFELIENELKRRGYKQHIRDQHTGMYPTGKTYKFELQKANGSRRARYNAWNEKILDRSMERCVIIDPKCEYLTYNCEELKLKSGTDDYTKPTESQIKVEPKLRFWGHPYDAASYLVNYYWGIKRDYEKKQDKQESVVEQFKSHR